MHAPHQHPTHQPHSPNTHTNSCCLAARTTPSKTTGTPPCAKTCGGWPSAWTAAQAVQREKEGWTGAKA